MSLTELTGNPWRDQLLMLIAERGYMNIGELANLPDVSTQAVCRDIRKLSEQGLIACHHGGAGRVSSVADTVSEQREVSQTEEKKVTAEAVADYIPDDSTIFITIGMTVEHVAWALLNHSHLRITTNSPCMAHILYHNPRFEVMVPSGTLHSRDSGIIGPSAVSLVADLRTDYLATSAGAIESDGAPMEFDVNEANVVKMMMAHARNILLVADHTKYHASAAAEIGNVTQVTALLTDELLPATLKSRLQDSQTEIILPQEDAQDFVTADPVSYLTT